MTRRDPTPAYGDVTGAAPRRRRVVFDHDGAPDDLLSLLLLTRYDHVDLRGVAVTPADCLLEPALSATRKILDLVGRDVPTAAGVLPGRNPFPLAWRIDALRVDALPVLNQKDHDTTRADRPAAHEQLATWLMRAPAPVTVLATGPLTNLARCLDDHPRIESRIEEVVFMGGALDVTGNVNQPGHDGTAEWNVFWDPGAVRRVFDAAVPITMFPLDVTDRVPVTPDLARAFGRHYGHPVSDLAGSLLALTFGTLETTSLPYCCWDSLTTSYLAEPGICTFETVHCDVITRGESQGRVVRRSGGRAVRCARTVDSGRFHRHLLTMLTPGPTPVPTPGGRQASPARRADVGPAGERGG
ncbi:purine nucleosidase [Streptosporangium becharense]|uniref:Purine nucleosidase n=1 Tax=Streptosporangium becharense TaxID=1816182 RepID=A0A7W9IKW6_9ACTN|nr:nucleoside hydrolase [Streptosporangium becharense]MBB2911686.1 purine nucleosidase [Streptosporangium becharense]MBB5822496.1 purine nucleosidase [Streptosporangium becharense]